MLCKIALCSEAKVNIGLKVLPKRNDGFHNIESIFQTVPLSDELEVMLLEDEKEECIVECEEMVLPENNTLTSTYKAFNALTGNKNSIKVLLKKRIPSGGGLGGGSSNGASLLRGLCELKKVILTDELADSVASKVGSDVFFFLHCYKNCSKNGCAVVTGRGEVVKPITPRNDLHFVMIFPEVHSSTKEAYELVDMDISSGKTVECPDLEELEKMYNENPQNWKFRNTFTPSLSKKYPLIAQALEDIRKQGALWTEMSGSGSTVFGVFSSIIEADKAFNNLNKKWNCFCC